MQITVKSGIDLVTEVDRECEDIIIAELKKAYPVGGLCNTFLVLYIPYYH